MRRTLSLGQSPRSCQRGRCEGKETGRCGTVHRNSCGRDDENSPESTKGSNKSSTSRPALQGEGAEVVPENIGATAALVAAHLSDTKRWTVQNRNLSATRLDSVTAVEVNRSYLSAVEVVKNMDETSPLLLSGSL